jgi:hypothetical protein
MHSLKVVKSSFCTKKEVAGMSDGRHNELLIYLFARTIILESLTIWTHLDGWSGLRTALHFSAT